ncbi:unnamed protein product, partial [Prunus brigantina]
VDSTSGNQLLSFISTYSEEKRVNENKEILRANKTSSAEPNLPEDMWQLCVDEASNQMGVGAGAFPTSTIQRVSQTKNAHADSLASLGSTLDTQFRSSIPVEHLDQPSIEEAKQPDLMWIDEHPSWQDPINDYLVIENLPNDKTTCLFTYHTPALISPASSNCKHSSCFAKYTMANVGTTLGADHLPRRLLTQTTSSLLYAKTPQRPMPPAPTKKDMMIVATNYFTKWIKPKALSFTKEVDFERFIWS